MMELHGNAVLLEKQVGYQPLHFHHSGETDVADHKNAINVLHKTLEK